jgi:hypothetical protein
MLNFVEIKFTAPRMEEKPSNLCRLEVVQIYFLPILIFKFIAILLLLIVWNYLSWFSNFCEMPPIILQVTMGVRLKDGRTQNPREVRWSPEQSLRKPYKYIVTRMTIVRQRLGKYIPQVSSQQ